MEELQKQTQTQTKTMVLEEVAPDVSTQEEKKIEAEKKLFPTRFVELEKKHQPLPSQKICLDVEKEVELEPQTQELAQTEVLVQEEIQPEEQPCLKQETEEVTQNENENEKEVEQQKVVKQANAKRFKTRLKLGLVAMLCVLTCFGGWAIYNAVKIQTLTSEAQMANSEYSVNVAKVIVNISKLDDLTNPNSITNLDELASANIVEVVPKAESFPKTLEKQSNWFDRVCNWISNLFK